MPITRPTPEEVRKDLEAHWSYTEKYLLKMIKIAGELYVDSGIHQHKHGWDDAMEEVRRLKEASS